MNKFIYFTVFLLSWASASLACSMSCCTDKQECCCKTQASDQADLQSSKDVNSVNATDCFCQESAPQPFAEASFITLLRNSSSKQICTVEPISRAAIQLSDYALSVDYSLLKSSHSPGFVTPLRI